MKFSIIVPTRNRPEYLPGAVRSALRQLGNFDFEVIVFDNASLIPATEALREISDSRLAIFRSEIALPMRDSWEKALSYASGDYITILGDDDAILPSAVAVSEFLIRKHNIKILRWDRAHYYWPNYNNSNSANLCRIPLGRTLFQVDGHWLLGQLASMKLSYSASPTIYNSWISRGLIETMKLKAGRVFHSASPDVDSGFAFAYLGRIFHHINFPLSICAQSAKSNGAQMHSECGGVSAEYELEVANDYQKLNKDANIRFDINSVETVWGGIATSYEQIAGILNIPARTFKLDKAELYQRILKEEFPKMTSANKSRYLSDLNEEIKRNPNKLKHLTNFISQNKICADDCRIQKISHRPKTGYEEHLRQLTIDSVSLGAATAEQVAVLVDKILGLNDRFDTHDFDYYPKNCLQNIKDFLYKVIRCRDYNFRNTNYSPGI